MRLHLSVSRFEILKLIYNSPHFFILFFQIKALQPNHFISHLIEVLAEDTVSIRGCDNTIATTATNDTGCYSCTISTYDSEEEELSKDPAR